MTKTLSLFFISLLLIPAIAFSQGKPKKMVVFNSNLELMVPGVLSPMSDNAWSTKYPGRQKPDLAVSDRDAEVSLVGMLTPQPATEDQIGDFKDFQKASLKKKYPDLQSLSDGVQTVNGKKVGYIKFISTAVDQKVYNEYFFIIVHGKIAFFTFNCIERLRGEWEKAGDEIVASIKVN